MGEFDLKVQEALQPNLRDAFSRGAYSRSPDQAVRKLDYDVADFGTDITTVRT